MSPDGSLQNLQEDLTVEADGGVVCQLRNIGTVSQESMCFGTADETVENQNSEYINLRVKSQVLSDGCQSACDTRKQRLSFPTMHPPLHEYTCSFRTTCCSQQLCETRLLIIEDTVNQIIIILALLVFK
jgi:hypothetical protein